MHCEEIVDNTGLELEGQGEAPGRRPDSMVKPHRYRLSSPKPRRSLLVLGSSIVGRILGSPRKRRRHWGLGELRGVSRQFRDDGPRKHGSSLAFKGGADIESKSNVSFGHAASGGGHMKELWYILQKQQDPRGSPSCEVIVKASPHHQIALEKLSCEPVVSRSRFNLKRLPDIGPRQY